MTIIEEVRIAQSNNNREKLRLLKSRKTNIEALTIYISLHFVFWDNDSGQVFTSDLIDNKLKLQKFLFTDLEKAIKIFFR